MASDRIIALDLATQCGFAVLYGRRRVESGRWTLRSGTKAHRGERWLKFESMLIDLIEEHSPTVIAYERIRRHVGTSAAHVYGGLLASVERLDYQTRAKGIEWVPMEVSTWKKTTVGHGGAVKSDVQAYVRRRFRYTAKTEDEADALAIAEAARLLRKEDT